MKRIKLCLMLGFLYLISGQICLSQSNSIIRSLNKAVAERLSLPTALSMFDTKTFEIEKIDSNQIEFRFFNESSVKTATITLKENLTDNSLLVSLSETSSQDWVRISRSVSTEEVQVSATTSSGGELLTKFAIEPANPVGKFRVLSIDIKVGGTTWQNFPASGTGSAEQRSLIHQAFKVEEDRLFSTNRLQKIREFLRGLDVLNSANSAAAGYGEPLDASCADDSSPAWGEPMPVYRRPGGCSGTAYCFRVATVIAVFVCNGGNTCSGVYLIPDRFFQIVFVTNCGYLNNCG